MVSLTSISLNNILKKSKYAIKHNRAINLNDPTSNLNNHLAFKTVNNYICHISGNVKNVKKFKESYGNERV